MPLAFNFSIMIYNFNRNVFFLLSYLWWNILFYSFELWCKIIKKKICYKIIKHQGKHFSKIKLYQSWPDWLVCILLHGHWKLRYTEKAVLKIIIQPAIFSIQIHFLNHFKTWFVLIQQLFLERGGIIYITQMCKTIEEYNMSSDKYLIRQLKTKCHVRRSKLPRWKGNTMETQCLTFSDTDLSCIDVEMELLALNQIWEEDVDRSASPV